MHSTHHHSLSLLEHFLGSRLLQGFFILSKNDVERLVLFTHFTDNIIERPAGQVLPHHVLYKVLVAKETSLNHFTYVVIEVCVPVV